VIPNRQHSWRTLSAVVALVLGASGATAQPAAAERLTGLDSNTVVSIPDDGYNGTLASMAASVIDTGTAVPAGHVVTSVRVYVGIDHTWVGDLTIKLRSPEGTILTLMSRPRGDLADPGGDDGSTTGGDSSDLTSVFPLSFSDSYNDSPETVGTALTSTGVACRDDDRCDFHAEPDGAGGPIGFNEAFAGQQASGVWTLYVGDSVSADTGQLTTWGLNIWHVRPVAPCTAAPFSDVATNHPFCSQIAWMKAEQVSTGFSDGTYRPSEPVTRQAMSAFIARLAGAELAACTSPPFPDVSTTHPFCAAIKWMKDTGVSTGFEDGTFRPAAVVTRQAMAAFLDRASIGGTSCTSAPFTDVPASSPFCDSIKWMLVYGVSSGFGDGTFRPTAAVTRQAMSAFMYKTSFWMP
jgi:subtilisin-like proprotein convertase family protein